MADKPKTENSETKHTDNKEVKGAIDVSGAVESVAAVKPQSQNMEVGGMVGAGNIDKIREILFGAQIQQYEHKFARLEELIKKEITNMRDDTKKSLDALENFTRKELESLSDELRAEKREKNEVVEEISESLKSTSKNLEKKIVNLEDKTVKGKRDLQDQLLKQSKELMEELRIKHEELSVALNDAVKDLTDKKTDRITLANLLTEMSMRLKEEFHLPEV